jgi:PiT family inorganic phosphate transporter
LFWLFLSGGLLLGVSLGANDAANVFGSAVGSRMLSFRRAAIIASLFVIAGAVIMGGGTSGTIGSLGIAVDIVNAFVISIAAGISIFLMTFVNVPVSTSQAVVGAIIGSNIFYGYTTDYSQLIRIVVSWTTSPVLGAIVAVILLLIVKYIIRVTKIHLIKLDAILRNLLIVAGAFGSFSLGANNIANVVGVFIPVADISDFNLIQGLAIPKLYLILFLGGIAIAIGIIFLSKRLMYTVGHNIMPLTPESALVVVLSHSIVLFLFSSVWLRDTMHGFGIPWFPMVPVSSSQVIIGSILGLSILKRANEINVKKLVAIFSGWIVSPVIAALLVLVLLKFNQLLF